MFYINQAKIAQDEKQELSLQVKLSSENYQSLFKEAEEAKELVIAELKKVVEHRQALEQEKKDYLAEKTKFHNFNTLNNN
jgi:hypothetical protein